MHDKPMEDGKMVEVLIKLLPRVEQKAPDRFDAVLGVNTPDRGYDILLVWADNGLQGFFEQIPGVFEVNVNGGRRYLIDVDPRYDTEWVMAEVEAVAVSQAKDPEPEKPITRPVTYYQRVRHWRRVTE